MSPQPACSEKRRRQGGSCRSGWKSHVRRCLLKGCECWFVPRRWIQRYCSSRCRQEADRWRRRKAQLEYRRSAKGRAKRAEQSRRWRQRQKEAARRRTEAERAAAKSGQRPSPPQESPGRGSEPAEECASPAPSEGHHSFVGEGDLCCDRPGCYVLFERSGRSPLRRFCSSSCHQAMRRVRAREARWRERAWLRSHVGRKGGRAPPRRRCRI